MTADLPMTSAAATPLAASERTVLIDALRGFALLGILVVNFGGSPGDAWPRIDSFLNEVIGAMAADSFYPLYSFLFGLGFAAQLRRGRERGSPVLRIYLRRLLALFLIGSVHCVLIWSGDILVPYAIIGLLLIPLQRLGDRWLVVLALAVLVLGGFSERVRPVVDSADWSPAPREARRLARTFASSALDGITQRVAQDPSASRWRSYRATVAGNWQVLAGRVHQQLSGMTLFSAILGFFLIGLVVGRRRLLQEAAAHVRGFGWVALAAGLLSVASTAWSYTHLNLPRIQTLLLYNGQNLGATCFYICAFAFAFAAFPTVAERMKVFAPAGRIGLTNYLMQSIVMTLPFATYGLRIDHPATTVWLLIDLAFFFAIQLPLSHWWVKRFRFGPAEWVWRSVTYSKPQPMH